MLLFAAACKNPEPFLLQTDFEKPVLTLTADTITLALGTTYTEPGVKVTDNQDTTISKSLLIQSNVNTQKRGVYEVNYTVRDKAGNTATAKRIVRVKITPENLIGDYKIEKMNADTALLYFDKVSGLTKGRLNLARFSSFVDANIKASLQGDLGTGIVVDKQSVLCGTDEAREFRNFEGTGSINEDASGFSIDYTEITKGIKKNYKVIYSKRY